MSEHRATVTWKRTSPGFTYEEYNRDHQWTFDGGIHVRASAAPEFRGVIDCVDPEEAFVASLSSCHMLTFLAIAARKRLVVDAYEDHAVGHMEKNDQGRLAVTRVDLHPRVRFSGSEPTPEELHAIHEQSHKDCFIANSVLSKVTVS
jgi:organic hydroperoxide reductase OsmC/OhrA